MQTLKFEKHKSLLQGRPAYTSNPPSDYECSHQETPNMTIGYQYQNDTNNLSIHLPAKLPIVIMQIPKFQYT